MATVEDIAVSGFINLASTLVFLLGFALLRIQPWADRVYNSKWYIKGVRKSSTRGGALRRFINLDAWSYLTFLNWMPEALMMSQEEIIKHAGLDSAIYLRIYTLGLKIFLPLTFIAIAVLIPMNVSGGTLLTLKKEVVFSDIDKLSISNIKAGSHRFWLHLGMAYLFTLWTCFILYVEYNKVASMRLRFVASQERCVEQFTVVVSNVPHGSGNSISETVEQFFHRNHPDHYLGHQGVFNANKLAELVRQKKRLHNWLDYNQIKFERHPDRRPTRKKGFLGLWGKKVDSIEFYRKKIQKLDKRIASERERVLSDPKARLPVAFVTFDSRWGAAVCAQTQQSKNPTEWLTDWAPEPRDLYWRNLSIPFVSLSIRRLLVSVSVFALVFCYMLPIAFVQTLANLEGLEKEVPFLKRAIEVKVIKSFLQGFIPGVVLKIFLYLLPNILMLMSKMEGYVSFSALERRAASKYYYFMLVNVFLGSIVTGTAFEQLHSFLHQSPAQIPITIGVSIPMKATFFITYIMLDGWAGIAAEILRLKPLVIYLLKDMLIVKTDKDREKALDPGSIDFTKNIPTVQLYFLLGLVYAAVTPILLPFIAVFFAFSYFVFRHQIINVYNQRYESAGAFWPHVHGRIVGSLLISQLTLLGLLSTKRAKDSTPLLLVLPVLTLWFHKYCKNRFESAFRKYPLQEATVKDKEEKTLEPALHLKTYLADAYLHPMFRDIEDDIEIGEVKANKAQSPPSSSLSGETTSPPSSPPRRDFQCEASSPPPPPPPPPPLSPPHQDHCETSSPPPPLPSPPHQNFLCETSSPTPPWPHQDCHFESSSPPPSPPPQDCHCETSSPPPSRPHQDCNCEISSSRPPSPPHQNFHCETSSPTPPPPHQDCHFESSSPPPSLSPQDCHCETSSPPPSPPPQDCHCETSSPPPSRPHQDCNCEISSSRPPSPPHRDGFYETSAPPSPPQHKDSQSDKEDHIQSHSC